MPFNIISSESITKLLSDNVIIIKWPKTFHTQHNYRIIYSEWDIIIT